MTFIVNIHVIVCGILLQRTGKRRVTLSPQPAVKISKSLADLRAREAQAATGRVEDVKEKLRMDRVRSLSRAASEANFWLSSSSSSDSLGD
jgi:hypothetical protein